MRITVNEFRAMVEGLSACTAISIDTETTPKLLKKSRITGEPCPYEDVVKVGSMSGLLGVHYDNACNNQLGREDKPMEFQSQERKWGTLSANRMMVCHIPKGTSVPKYYLQVVVRSSTTPIYLWRNTEINKAELEAYLPIPSAPKTQEDLDKKVILRDIAVENVRVVRMLGEEYIIADQVESERHGQIERRVLEGV